MNPSEWLAIVGLALTVTGVLARILIVSTKTHTKVETIMTNHLPHIQAEVSEVRNQLVTHLQEHINKS